MALLMVTASKFAGMEECSMPSVMMAIQMTAMDAAHYV